MEDERSRLEAAIDACVQAWRSAKDALASATALFVLHELETRLAKLRGNEANTDDHATPPDDEPLPQ